MAEEFFCIADCGQEMMGKGYMCHTCRADLELGRLVRAMKPGTVLTHAAKEDLSLPEKPWECYSYVVDGGGCAVEKTPEEALKGK
mgnify:FL=1